MAHTVTTTSLAVYSRCMSRTNIDIDDELIAAAMEKFNVRTKREAVDIALRRSVGTPLSTEFLLSLRGIGWEGDLDEMRGSRADLPKEGEQDR